MSNIQRPRVVKNRLLRITSYGQVQYDSNGHISVSLPKTIPNVQTMRVQSYSFPYSFYNIDSHNNTLIFGVDPAGPSPQVFYTIQLLEQHYEVFSFVAALTSALNQGHNNGFLVTYTTSNNKITVTGNSPFTFKSTSTMKYVLGFEGDTSSQTNGAVDSITFSSGVNLLRSPELLVNCDQVVSYSSWSLSESVLFTVPLSGFVYGDSVFHQQDHVPIPVKETSMSSLVFKITDVDHNVIDFKDYRWVINLILEVLE